MITSTQVKMVAIHNIRTSLLFFASLSICHVIGDGTSAEPKCHSRFDYDYKLMQKLAALEQEQKSLREEVLKQTSVINELQKELKDTIHTQWGEWTTWSNCSYECSGHEGGRQQTRERTRLTPASDKQTEIETRPCNAVQFAGCVKQHGPDDNFGVVYDFADQVALSTCSALLEAVGYVYAVRRQCSNLAVSCDETCKNLKLKCFNSLHVHRTNPTLGRDEVGKKGLYLYRYNSCGGNYCGPNFCCCKG